MILNRYLLFAVTLLLGFASNSCTQTEWEPLFNGEDLEGCIAFQLHMSDELKIRFTDIYIKETAQ